MNRTRRIAAVLLLASAALGARAEGTVRVVTKNAAGNPVADAVAYVVALDAAAPVHPPVEPVAIVQRNQDFEPYVTAIVVGTRVVFPNKDNVQHHVYSV